MADSNLFVSLQTNSVGLCAATSLTDCVRNSQASTFSELMLELERAIQALTSGPGLENRVALQSASELFKRFITRISHDEQDFDEVKKQIVKRAEFFTQRCSTCRRVIAEKLRPFLQHDTTILIHGYSRMVAYAIINAARKNKRLKLFITESLPDQSGGEFLRVLQTTGNSLRYIAITLIRDSAAAAVMADIDFVLLGAEGVVETGGIVNKIGTYQIAIAAKCLGKPVYVAVESYKFLRHYPLAQSDVPQPLDRKDKALEKDLPPGVRVDHRFSDYTPPEFITLLFTDLGILTPSAVSDELIKLYHEALLNL